MIKVVQNDYGYKLNFTLYEGDGSLVTLTHVDKIELRWNWEQSSTYLTAEMTKSTGTGQCFVVIPSSGFEEHGKYHGQVLLYSTGKRVSATDIAFDVKKEVPK